jgi:hypothetical protein
MFGFLFGDRRPRLPSLRSQLEHQGRYLKLIREDVMAISKQVQEALDRIRQTQGLMASFKASSALQSQQIATLTEKVTELQGKLTDGQQISADDVAALAEISSDIDQVNTDLKSAVPANTTNGQPPAVNGPGDANAPPAPNPPEAAEPPAPEDPTQHAADAAAASQAKPLGG